MATEARWSSMRIIGCFLVSLMALAGAIRHFLSPTELAIFIFAIIVIVVSLETSKRRLIDRLRADQTYYSLVAIVISAAYVVEAPKRDQVISQFAQRELLDKAELARESLATITAIHNDQARFFGILRERFAAERRQTLSRILAPTCKDYDLEQARALPSLGAAELKSFYEVIKTERSRGSQIDNFGMQCLYDLAIAVRPEWEEISRVATIEGYFPVRKFAATVGSEVDNYIMFDGKMYEVYRINEILFSDDEQPDIARRVRILENQITQWTAEAKAISNKPNGSAPNWLTVNLGRLVYFYWPFAIIALLGLKLARRP